METKLEDRLKSKMEELRKSGPTTLMVHRPTWSELERVGREYFPDRRPTMEEVIQILLLERKGVNAD